MSIVRCPYCDALSKQQVKIKNGLSAYCPCCDAKLSRPDCLSLSGELALCIAALLFFIPTQYFGLVSINLFAVELTTSVSSGAISILFTYPVVSILVIFCVIISPLSFICSLFLAHFSLYIKSYKLLFIATSSLKNLRSWVMIDVFLVSLAIGCIKVSDYTDIIPRYGLICFIGMHLCFTLLLSRLSLRRYWDILYPAESFNLNLKELPYIKTLTCTHCHFTQSNQETECLRCHQIISQRKENSLQKTWAYIVTASILIIPANIYPISILINNGTKTEDTILSGIASLIQDGLYGIAIVIFIASIAVPLIKIIGLVYVLCCIHFGFNKNLRFRAKLYRFIHTIGKWSMMDLCVITIMLTLLNRGSFLEFFPGPASSAFGLVVLFTMLAAESLDPRLIWDGADKSRLAKYYRQDIQP